MARSLFLFMEHGGNTGQFGHISQTDSGIIIERNMLFEGEYTTEFTVTRHGIETVYAIVADTLPALRIKEAWFLDTFDGAPIEATTFHNA